MFASTVTVAPPATTTSLSFDSPYEPQTLFKPSPRSFKKHKVLPHPSADVVGGGSPAPSDLANDYQNSSNPTRKSVTLPRNTRGFLNSGVIGPNPPPTPPAHSRTLSAPRQNPASSTTSFDTPLRGVNATGTVTPGPSTPTLQRSPPTPDVTPPQVGRRPKGLRPTPADRISSKGTNDSRTESFKTARESPGISDEEKTTPRLLGSAAKTPQNVMGRQVEPKPGKQRNAVLALALDFGDDLTPKTKQEFCKFDGEWTLNSEVEQEWDDNLNRNVIVRKHPGQQRNIGWAEVMEDVAVTPTNGTKALGPMRLHEHKQSATLPQTFSLESASKGRPRRPTSISESSMSTDLRRSSGMSTKSTISTVVEAILVDVPPQRRKTLRHVRKQTTLRDSGSEFSPSSSTSNSVRQIDKTRQPMVPGNPTSPRTNSMASVGTVVSIASRKARRQVWKNGGIPVVVIPDRKESLKYPSTGPPSLRSRESHHSKRSNSLGPGPRSTRHPVNELSSSSDKPPRRGRPVSMTYGLYPNDRLTVDYPPIVPKRTSSLSAPTSRNTSQAGSRTGSLTAESLKAHNALLQQERNQSLQARVVEPMSPSEHTSSGLDQKQTCTALSVESHKNEIPNQRPLFDHNSDPLFDKRLTAYNTPFSQVSVETNGTHSAADIAEAMAVNIYSHQNKSVLMVHHVSKPVNTANNEQFERFTPTNLPVRMGRISGYSEFVVSGLGSNPVTPTQPWFLVNNTDSPLRSPRIPPEPPSIHFMPATPSGMVTASEKQMKENLFEESQDRPSLVRRALSLRKSSSSVTSRSLLARTLSLSKTIRRDTGESLESRNMDPLLHRRSTANNPLSNESKRHPSWHPAHDPDTDTDDLVYDVSEPNHPDGRYLPSSSRLAPRQRSLNERMRRTVASLPIEDDDHYITANHRSPERRTIKRTPSGNLRVVPHRDELNSNRRSGLFTPEGGERPSTAPENSNHRIWGVEKRVDDRGRRIFPGWQEKLEQYRPQNLQRRLSEHRRQKRTEALRQKISGPREVRDGVGDVIKRSSYSGPSYQSTSKVRTSIDRK
ncbi:hypothetical protein GGS21DRAFT_217993 [Xylaria nigripes]|nr:hypothetical protein GGS21DRAFT_217993 [Xylaria nigripes]